MNIAHTHTHAHAYARLDTDFCVCCLCVCVRVFFAEYRHNNNKTFRCYFFSLSQLFLHTN